MIDTFGFAFPKSIKKSKNKPTHVTRDSRLVLSKHDWRKMKLSMWDELAYGTGPPFPRVICGICGLEIRSFEDFEPDHIIPRGMGGGTRDDGHKNLQPSHRRCNREKGSQRGYKT